MNVIELETMLGDLIAQGKGDLPIFIEIEGDMHGCLESATNLEEREISGIPSVVIL